ncbi:hypothetical protein GQR58_026441 [Nymphon striatum]|nr:hypothetical protein GQR58_026441 [Nymphon striatum]
MKHSYKHCNQLFSKNKNNNEHKFKEPKENNKFIKHYYGLLASMVDANCFGNIENIFSRTVQKLCLYLFIGRYVLCDQKVSKRRCHLSYLAPMVLCGSDLNEGRSFPSITRCMIEERESHWCYIIFTVYSILKRFHNHIACVYCIRQDRSHTSYCLYGKDGKPWPMYCSVTFEKCVNTSHDCCSSRSPFVFCTAEARVLYRVELSPSLFPVLILQRIMGFCKTVYNELDQLMNWLRLPIRELRSSSKRGKNKFCLTTHVHAMFSFEVVPYLSMLLVHFISFFSRPFVSTKYHGTQCFLYVDDLVVAYASKSISTIERHLQLSLNKIEKWTNENGFKFSSSKTVKESILCRLRVGHTYLTHSFLLRNEAQPVCGRCQQTLTVRHVLVDCAALTSPIFGADGTIKPLPLPLPLQLKNTKWLSLLRPHQVKIIHIDKVFEIIITDLKNTACVLTVKFLMIRMEKVQSITIQKMEGRRKDVIESIQVIPEIFQSTPEGLPPLLDNSILSEDGGTAETERSSSSASSKKSTSNSDLLEFIEKQDDKHEVMLFKLQKVFREQEEMIWEKEEQRRRKYDEEIDQKRRRYDEEVEQNRRKYEDELEMKRRKEESEEAEGQRCHERKLFELLLKK